MNEVVDHEAENTQEARAEELSKEAAARAKGEAVEDGDVAAAAAGEPPKPEPQDDDGGYNLLDFAEDVTGQDLDKDGTVGD